MKKKNPQDATLRNINALKKRVSKLERILEHIVVNQGSVSSIILRMIKQKS